METKYPTVIRDRKVKQWFYEAVEGHLGRPLDRSNPVVSDGKGNTMIMMEDETLMFDGEDVVRLVEIPGVGIVSEQWFHGEMIRSEPTTA